MPTSKYTNILNKIKIILLLKQKHTLWRLSNLDTKDASKAIQIFNVKIFLENLFACLMPITSSHVTIISQHKQRKLTEPCTRGLPKSIERFFFKGDKLLKLLMSLKFRDAMQISHKSQLRKPFLDI